MNPTPIEPIAPPHPHEEINRLELVRELIDTMTRLTGPRQHYPLVPPQQAMLPDGQPVDKIVKLAHPAQLACAAADSAREIAIATAALGSNDGQDDARAKEIWRQTLEQIARVQKLYGLPPLHFQSKELPSPGLEAGT